ncbi:Rrf2 family transcriptional regulator [Acidihalobacter prosperus]|uniref:BadM/Rrf2 family transcriptional regulator n=1 Tax=Acidihalobacter prosperus TaxID=160660 RepID=A0A1A6C2W1_9GAMM|nr:Rrf2 family transcriptional regulator [Acidihalobacter prosperus]OBS08885.1 hypothetical protein Thpro_023135 [Acidihalobacter prosperus]
MHLTQHTDFSLRVLMYLGAMQDRLVTIDELTTRLHIARSHLAKIVNRLARLGYITTLRGKGGGMRLARPPAEIGIGAVVRDTEPGTTLIDCESPACSILGICALVGTLAQAKSAFFEVLDDVTLADLVANGDALRRRFEGAGSTRVIKIPARDRA